MAKLKKLGFRAWFYLRMGYTTYWAFLFMGINTVTVTYYLAIDNLPILREVFPSFIHYVTILIIAGIPLLILTGYIHFKKTPGYKSEAEVTFESHPYQFKLPPGWWLHVIVPYFRLQSDILKKISEDKKLDDKDLKKLNDLQEKMDHLMKGGYVGDENRIKRFESHD